MKVRSDVPEKVLAQALWNLSRKLSLPENKWMTFQIVFRQNKKGITASTVQIEFGADPGNFIKLLKTGG
jgi:hypothetical protein